MWYRKCGAPESGSDLNESQRSRTEGRSEDGTEQKNESNDDGNGDHLVVISLERRVSSTGLKRQKSEPREDHDRRKQAKVMESIQVEMKRTNDIMGKLVIMATANANIELIMSTLDWLEKDYDSFKELSRQLTETTMRT